MLGPSSNNRTLSYSHKRGFTIIVKGFHNCANTFVSKCTSNDTYIILTDCERITRYLPFCIASLAVVDKISCNFYLINQELLFRCNAKHNIVCIRNGKRNERFAKYHT